MVQLTGSTLSTQKRNNMPLKTLHPAHYTLITWSYIPPWAELNKQQASYISFYGDPTTDDSLTCVASQLFSRWALAVWYKLWPPAPRTHRESGARSVCFRLEVLPNIKESVNKLGGIFLYQIYTVKSCMVTQFVFAQLLLCESESSLLTLTRVGELIIRKNDQFTCDSEFPFLMWCAFVVAAGHPKHSNLNY